MTDCVDVWPLIWPFQSFVKGYDYSIYNECIYSPQCINLRHQYLRCYLFLSNSQRVSFIDHATHYSAEKLFKSNDDIWNLHCHKKSIESLIDSLKNSGWEYKREYGSDTLFYILQTWRQFQSWDGNIFHYWGRKILIFLYSSDWKTDFFLLRKSERNETPSPFNDQRKNHEKNLLWKLDLLLVGIKIRLIFYTKHRLSVPILLSHNFGIFYSQQAGKDAVPERHFKI